jgi:hypothetical protein
MACVKLGCELFPGKSYAGESIPVAIGIDPNYFSNRLDVCYTFDKNELGKLLPARMMNSHKGSYGKVLMITGSPGMAGAAFLSACAAYTVGAGLVQIYTASENRLALQNFFRKPLYPAMILMMTISCLVFLTGLMWFVLAVDLEWDRFPKRY